MSENIEIWSTKYALTEGIRHFLDAEINGDMAVIKRPMMQFVHKEGRGWHRSFFVAAQKRAEEMRLKKIENLKKQIRKLEQMTFEESKVQS